MEKAELESLKKENDKLEYDLVSKQNIYLDQFQNKIKELENKLAQLLVKIREEG